MDNNCLFCKIIKGEVPSTKVYEDDYVLGFRDINPAAKIHILVRYYKITKQNSVNWKYNYQTVCAFAD